MLSRVVTDVTKIIKVRNRLPAFRKWYFTYKSRQFILLSLMWCREIAQCWVCGFLFDISFSFASLLSILVLTQVNSPKVYNWEWEHHINSNRSFRMRKYFVDCNNNQYFKHKFQNTKKTNTAKQYSSSGNVVQCVD